MKGATVQRALPPQRPVFDGYDMTLRLAAQVAGAWPRHDREQARSAAPHAGRQVDKRKVRRRCVAANSRQCTCRGRAARFSWLDRVRTSICTVPLRNRHGRLPRTRSSLNFQLGDSGSWAAPFLSSRMSGSDGRQSGDPAPELNVFPLFFMLLRRKCALASA